MRRHSIRACRVVAPVWVAALLVLLAGGCSSDSGEPPVDATTDVRQPDALTDLGDASSAPEVATQQVQGSV